jgi:hypothetical protein
MDIIEMHDWFDLIQDKVDTTYYLTPEKDQFINRAIQLFINDVIHQFNEDPQGRLTISSNLEESLNASEVLRPLMLIDLPVSSNSSGVITDTAIDAAIATKIGETGTFLHILGLTDDADLPVHYVRENDFAKFQQNEFKQATTTNRQYRIGVDGLYCAPTGVIAYTISLIKAPTEVSYTSLVSTDLPNTVHDYVLAKALELAGLASRDEALTRMRTAV